MQYALSLPLSWASKPSCMAMQHHPTISTATWPPHLIVSYPPSNCISLLTPLARCDLPAVYLSPILFDCPSCDLVVWCFGCHRSFPLQFCYYFILGSKPIAAADAQRSHMQAYTYGSCTAPAAACKLENNNWCNL